MKQRKRIITKNRKHEREASKNDLAAAVAYFKKSLSFGRDLKSFCTTLIDFREKCSFFQIFDNIIKMTSAKKNCTNLCLLSWSIFVKSFMA